LPDQVGLLGGDNAIMMGSAKVGLGFLIFGLVTGSAGVATAQNVAPCPNQDACARLTVGQADAAAGEAATIPITFRQANDDGKAGGPDETAAIAFTMTIPGLRLADCTLDAEGLPGAVKPDPAISNFKVVVENASCGNGRTHCLCPGGGGITPDEFVNIVIYGPNPLPTPGPEPVEIPTLPAGPQDLLTIDLQATTGGTIPLHVLNEVDDSQRPQFHAFLSIGDDEAVDQTCVPVPSSPPCSAPGSVSQVVVTDGEIRAAGPACVGDCGGEGDVTVDEIITMVNIALGNVDISECLAGDASGDGQITVDEIITAVNNALDGCPQ
jgi:hypothetical protein